MKNTWIVPVALMGLASAALAENYTIDSDFSAVNFEIPRLGFSTQFGRFNKTYGKAQLDFANRKGSVDFTILSASIDMGVAAWARHLSDPGLLNVKAYPTMHYTAERLIFEQDKVIGAEGQLTMLGVTQPLAVQVKEFQCGPHPLSKKWLCSGNIVATVKRSEFGLTKYLPVVSDEIVVKVPVDAYRD